MFVCVYVCVGRQNKEECIMGFDKVRGSGTKGT